MTQLYTIRGGTREDVLARKYNISIGVSIGNKWFTPDNVRKVVQWALHHTRERVGVYVADSIHGINISIRQRIPPSKAKELALKQGRKCMDAIKTALDTLPPYERSRIDFCCWEEIETAAHLRARDWLYTMFRDNSAFRAAITTLVEQHVSKERRHFTESDISAFATYILEELPELMNTTRIGRTVYDAYIYPHDTQLTIFVEQLQNAQIFPEVAKEILKEPKVFLEVR
jgi:tRNA-dependent cyclodipeptide synthase